METIELEKKKEPEGPNEHMKKFEALYKENIKYEISIFKRGNHLVVETTIEKDSQNKLYSNFFEFLFHFLFFFLNFIFMYFISYYFFCNN